MRTQETDIPSETLNRIKDDIQIARNVIQQCKKSSMSHSKKKHCNEMALVLFYTGIEYSESLHNLMKGEKTTTFADWRQYLDYTAKNPAPSDNISHELLRKVVFSEYVEKMRIPNQENLLQAFEAKLKRVTYKETLEKAMNKHGFIWKRLGNSKKYMIVEKTEQVAQRMRYLYHLNQIRETDTIIVHMEFRSIDLRTINESVKIDVAIAVSHQLGRINAVVNTSGDSPTNIETLLGDYINRLPEDTVFVIEQSPGYKDENANVPAELKTKQSIIKWLQANDILHNPKSHRGELISLIKKYKSRHNMQAKCVQFLTARNFKVFFRPPELKSFFQFLWDKLAEVPKTNLKTLKKKFLKIIDAVGDDNWREQTQELANFEHGLLEEEQKLELVIDKLMESIKNNTLTEADIKNCQEQVFNEEYFNTLLTE